ncbi:unnamed protein product [Nezara viridula]|uniref:THO complex subunit 7 n=1 Tax=Nezara viridula TaxID=85310 RepID=A0A9P0HFD8_NEZVI|nr:unnamed protein product [Nezara viridula]
MDEEEIIRRRLLIDGDGTGDDRRINVLLKKFFKWCNSEDSTIEGKDHLLSQISQCEYAFVKSRLAASMVTSELDNYDNVAKQIQENLSQVQTEIADAKDEFKDAKLIRKNRLEYEALAKIINEQPDRKETNEKLINIKKELQVSEERLEYLEAKLELRRKQFHVLFTSLQQLQAVLDADESVHNEGLEVIDEDDDEISALISRCISESSEDQAEMEQDP